jgi:hypothetical protein
VNRRFRVNELSLNEVAANVAPFRPHVEASSGAATPPVASGESYRPSALVAQTRMHDALHTYLTASLGYDHATVTPLFGRIAELIEHELQLARKGQADEAGR